AYMAFGSLLEVHFRIYRHAGTKVEILVLPRVEMDSLWNALHEFHIIPGRILRREQAEGRAGGSPDSSNPAMIFVLIGIHAESHPLAGLHLPELRLLE